MEKNNKLPPAKIKVETATTLKHGDLDDLCDSTELAIIEGGGFGCFHWCFHFAFWVYF